MFASSWRADCPLHFHLVNTPTPLAHSCVSGLGRVECLQGGHPARPLSLAPETNNKRKCSVFYEINMFVYESEQKPSVFMKSNILKVWQESFSSYTEPPDY